MNTVTGVIGCPDKNGYVLLSPCSPSSFSLELDTSVQWEIGIDQSSSCTGIALHSIDNRFVVLLDVRRDKHLQKDVFYRELHILLRKLVKGADIRYIAIEKPVPSKYRSAGAVLLELKGKLEDWIWEIPELQAAAFDSMYPQSWKSLVMDAGKGKNRMNVKSEIAADLVDRYPCLRFYYTAYTGGGYDSFDALGILEGYREYAYTSNGSPMICGSTEKTHVSLVGYCWAENEKIASKEIFSEIFGEHFYVFRPVFRAYNSRYNLHHNIRMASSNFKSLVTLLPAGLYTELQWDLDYDFMEEGKSLLMFVFRRGSFTQGEVKCLKALITNLREELDN